MDTTSASASVTSRLLGRLRRGAAGASGARSDNAPRFADQPRAGHVESWFLRANHPREPRALWLKITVLRRLDGEAVAEAWCSLFDGVEGRAWGARQTVALSDARFATHVPLSAEVGDCALDLDEGGGSIRGALSNARGAASWELEFERVPRALGEPLCALPTRRLIDAKLPRNKFLTPLPALRFRGRVVWDGQPFEVEDWLGMQGHNWGSAHAPEYAWGQCVFTGGDGVPFAMVEAASGRIELAGRTTPLLSLMVVRRGERELRFDRLLDTWNHRSRIDFPQWSLRMKGPHGTALLSMQAEPGQMVCLGYENPDRSIAYCLNSKLARVTLRVNPVNDDAFECSSAHGGALEFLTRGEEPRVQPVV